MSATVRWLLTDRTDGFPGASGWGSGSWFAANSAQFWVRSAAAWVMWLIAAALLAAIGAIVLPMVVEALLKTYSVLHDEVLHFMSGRAHV